MSLTPAPLRLPGLDPDRRYRIEHVPLPGGVRGVRVAATRPGWFGSPIELSGRQLAAHGVQFPVMWPETALLLHLTS